MVHSHTVHLALGALLSPCTVCGYRFRFVSKEDEMDGLSDDEDYEYEVRSRTESNHSTIWMDGLSDDEDYECKASRSRDRTRI